MNSGSGMPDLMDILINVGAIAPTIIQLMQGLMALAGVWLTGMAIMEFYCTSNENAARFLPGAQRFTVGSATVQLIIGAALISLSTLELIGIATRTATGTEVTSRLMAYQSGGNTMADEASVAVHGILALIQLMGFCAVAKSLFMFNAHAHAKDHGSPSMAWGFFVGGLIAWNFQIFAEGMHHLIGFNILGAFTGSST